MSDFYARHEALLKRAVDAIGERAYFAAFPEQASPKVYGESAKADGDAAFEALIGKPFVFDEKHPKERLVGAEFSPFGKTLDIRYPAAPVERLVAASQSAGEAWGRAPIEERAGVLLEALTRLNKQSFLMADAVQHTSGQPYGMAFQAGGPHAQDRALEAIAYAVTEMRRAPRTASWEKPQGKGEPIRLDKRFRIVPRGVALAIGCSTFPTWNLYPGLFASLAAGNTVIAKPHPAAILPAAITIKTLREVLAEAGFDPNVALLAADEPSAPIAKELAERPEVKIVDFTGGPAFGAWLRHSLPDKLVYTEEAGVNAIVIDSTANFRGMCDNIAFSLSLYSGQMCTAPQNIFVAKGGVDTDEGRKSFEEVASGVAAAVDRLLADKGRAAAIAGAIQSDATLERVKAAASLGRVVRPSAPVEGIKRSATPLILAVEAKDEAAYGQERFGPIAFIVAAESTEDCLGHAESTIRAKGAITAALYTTSEKVAEAAEEAFARASVALSINLIGNIFVNQSAAFSDYHVTGGNPAGNATLTDAAFVANRFRIASVRRMAA